MGDALTCSFPPSDESEFSLRRAVFAVLLLLVVLTVGVFAFGSWSVDGVRANVFGEKSPAAAEQVLSGSPGVSPTDQGAVPTTLEVAGAVKPIVHTAPSIEIAWVGDTTPGSRYGLPPNAGREQFSGVKPALRKPDLTIGNLEGTLGSGGPEKCGMGSASCYAFQAPASYAKSLHEAGFDVFSLANNHALDYGDSGQRQTVAALDRNRIAHTGRPGETAFVSRKGIRIAVLAFAPYSWADPLLDIYTARRRIKEAAANADIVVVAIHAGAEGSDKVHVPKGYESAYGENRGNSRLFAHMAVDAGADLVVGSGPHVLRGVEQYKGHVIAYSTGNFSGYKNFGSGGALSLSGIVKVRLTKEGKTLSGAWVPVKLVGPGLPVIDGSGAALALVRQVSNADFGRNSAKPDSSGSFHLR